MGHTRRKTITFVSVNLVKAVKESERSLGTVFMLDELELPSFSVSHIVYDFPPALCIRDRVPFCGAFA